MKERATPLVAAAAVAAVSLAGAAPTARAATEPTTPDTTAPTTTPTTAPPVSTTEPPVTTTEPPVTTTVPPVTTTEAPQSTTTTSVASSSTTDPGTGSTTSTSTPTGPTTTTIAGGPTTAPGSTTTTIPSTTTTTSTTLVPPPAQLGFQVPAGGDYAAILLTIRTLESGNNYTIPKNRGGASGAYQFVDSTWKRFGGYQSAYLAPPAVQDQKALLDVQTFLAQWGGDVSMIPVMWYYPKAAFNPELMDQVPMPGAGNTLTIREYQYKWMRLYQRFSGKVVDLSLYQPAAVLDRLGLPPLVEGGLGELQQIAFPVLGDTTVHAPFVCEGECEPGQDAIVYGRQYQPILAAFDGVVTAVEPGDSATDQVSVTVTDELGRTYTYRGFNSPRADDPTGENPDGVINAALSLSSNARVGATVRAGMVLGFMGDTDPMPADTDTDDVWPHLRLTIREVNGERIDANRLVNEAQNREACRVGVGPWSMPADARIGIEPEYPTFDAIVVDRAELGSWTIHPDGTVTAVGASALILPEAGCSWYPAEAYGPGAAGLPMPEELMAPIELQSALYVKGAVDASADGLPNFLR